MKIFLVAGVMLLLAEHGEAADGCGVEGDPGHGKVRCGESCTGWGGSCTCGEGSKKFNHRDNRTWCCNGSQCERNGRDVSCKKGTALPLTTQCEGKCNDFVSHYAQRQYKACDEVQCIKPEYWADETFHCRDRSDERKRPEQVYTAIQWHNMTKCDYMGKKYLPGVTCTGVEGVPGCLEYPLWCNDKMGSSPCYELGGRNSMHREVCSNNTFWGQHSCKYWDYEGTRCSSGFSGQCFYGKNPPFWMSTTCRDGSHLVEKKVGDCPLDYFPCLVNGTMSCLHHGLHCDAHPNCQHGIDEKNCRFLQQVFDNK